MGSKWIKLMGVGLLLFGAAPADALPLPSTESIVKGLKAEMDTGKESLKKVMKADVASQSVLPPWNGPKWDYLHAPLAKFDASSLGNPLTSVAAALANSMIDDGVRLNNAVVSFQYLGDHGWEFVAIHNGIAYFKRPRGEEPNKPLPPDALP